MTQGWSLTPLGEVLIERRETPGAVDLASGRVHIIEKISFDTGSIKVRSDNSTRTGMILVRPGDLVVSGINAAKGAIAIYDPNAAEPAAATIHYGAYAVNLDRADARFLWWMLRSRFFQDLLRECLPGGIKTELKAKRLLPVPVPLPPLLEQRRIVTRLGELATLIEQGNRLRQQAAKEAEGLHLSLLHQHFVENASKWASMPMQEAIKVSDRQVAPTLPEYSKLPHISGENIESKTCRLLPYRTAEEDGVRSNNYLYSPGTVLYSKIRPYLRKAVFVDFRGLCSADIYPIQVISPQLDPHFVMWSLVADPFTDYANRLSGRTRMPKLNRPQLFRFTLLYPPLSEQLHIVAELDALQAEVDRLKRLQGETAAELEVLLPAILDQAFKGEL